MSGVPTGSRSATCPEADIQDVFRVKTALRFAVKFDPKAEAAFDRILNVLDDLTELVDYA